MDSLAEGASWMGLLCDAELSRRTAKAVIRRWAVEQARPLSTLWDLTAEELQEQLSLGPDDAERVLAARSGVSAAEALLRAWAERGVALVTRADVAYPELLLERLSEEAVPYFFLYAGDLAIATQPGIAILGSGAPTPEAEALVRELTGLLGAEGHHLVEGYARGVDRLAATAAIDMGGQVTAVLPVGFDAFRPALAKLTPCLDEGRMLILSPYALDEPYDERLADARLVLIGALSAALVLIEPSASPADWLWLSSFYAWGGVTLIWSGGAPERVRPWIESGALPFEDAISGAAEIARVFGATQEATADATPARRIAEDDDLAPYASPDEALRALARGGVVPEALARRLHKRQGKGVDSV